MSPHLSSTPTNHKQTQRAALGSLATVEQDYSNTPAPKISVWVWIHTQRNITKWDFIQHCTMWFLRETC